MSKKDLIDAVAAATGLTKDKAGAAVDAVADHIVSTLKAGGEVAFAPIGKFKVAKRDARTGRNPATGEAVEIKASVAAKFQPSKTLKDALN